MPMTRLQVLQGAVRCAIAHKTDRKSISVPKWAETYGVTQKLVRDTWEAELTKIEPNTREVGEGK
jgi:hypothetical protein